MKVGLQYIILYKMNRHILCRVCFMCTLYWTIGYHVSVCVSKQCSHLCTNTCVLVECHMIVLTKGFVR